MATAMNEYFPFSTGAGATVTEAQWREMAREWLATGVLAGYLNELQVVQAGPAAMTVVVKSGQARIEGHVAISTGDKTLAVTANASGNPRIDLVVLRARFDTDVIELDVKAGVAGVAPVAPVVVQSGVMWEIALAQVAVANGALSIVTANITDVRAFSYTEADPPLPVYTTTERDALTHVFNGLTIYNSTLAAVQTRIAGTWTTIAVLTATGGLSVVEGAFTGDVTVDKGVPKVTIGGVAAGRVAVQRDGATAAADPIGDLVFRGQDSAANVEDYATIAAEATDPTNASEDGRLRLHVLSGGLSTEYLRLDGTDAGPRLITDRLLDAGGSRFLGFVTGSPEGVVTSAVGGFVLRKDGALGTIAYMKVTGAGNTGWVALRLAGGTTVRVAWNYLLPNEIKVPAGAADFLPGALISVPAGQAVTLVGYQWYLSSGTSFTFKLQHKTGATLGTNTDLVTGVVAASASVKGSGTFTKVCADADAWFPVITAVSGTPSGGTIDMLADITV